jgi:hypothetical protein
VTYPITLSLYALRFPAEALLTQPLRLVHSKKETNSVLASVRSRPSSVSYSRSSSKTTLVEKVALLQRLGPGAAAVIEQLVDDCLARLNLDL